MTIKGQAYIAGIYEHPTRKADDKSLAQLHAEVAKGALAEAGTDAAPTSTADEEKPRRTRRSRSCRSCGSGGEPAYPSRSRVLVPAWRICGIR